METCDVLIVGGGPAGSACAGKLVEAGLDVIVIDRAAFPRDKVCAGWITPQVIADLHIDVDEYRHGRTFQPITGFRTGLVDGAGEMETTYDRPVSFGIRRCEFDHYLLQRSGAGLRLGAPISSIRRDGAQWVVNQSVKAPMLVGAGGHFCPVARQLNPVLPDAPLVVAQEVEFPIDPRDEAAFTIAAEKPELYFYPDLTGYGWCFRKQDHLNVGVGRLNRRALPKESADFVAFLKARRKIPADASWRWRGHAYLLSDPPRRRVADRGVLLVGDAAGLAYPQSGEGIRPAIESGLLAAATIVDADGQYTRDRLESYTTDLGGRLGLRSVPRMLVERMVEKMVEKMVERTLSGLTGMLLPRLLDMPWFVRNLLLDRWFLHAHEPALVTRS